MKICLLIVAVAALCCAVDASPLDFVKRSAGYGGGYGAEKVVTPVVAPVIQMDHSAGYGAEKVVTPVVAPVIQMDHSAGYGAEKVVTPVVAPVIQMDHSAGCGAEKVVTPVVAPVIQMDHSTSYGAEKFVAPVIQMDHSAGYGAEKVVTPVVAPVIQMDHSTSYGAEKVVVPVVAPVIQMDQSVSYGAEKVVTPIITENVETIEITDPALINLCLTRSTGQSIFYLPHPTKQDSYIQCDQYGKSFLKKCPFGTIFTLNLVCENPADLHTVVDTHSAIVDVTPAVTLDQTYGSYGSAPVFQADQPGTIETSSVEVIREAPEFKERCLLKSAAYGYSTESIQTVFYVTHPTNPHMFIQCDNFGKAFLKECPMNLIFTRNLVCERIGEEVVPTETVVVPETPQVALDTSVSYGAAAVVARPHLGAPVISSVVESISGRDAPEFNELCLSKINYGGQVKQIFYIAHPSKQTSFIQCDEFGKAFVKECPLNTIFTLNLVCESIEDLHAIEEHTEKVPLVQQSSDSYGSYGSAPVFTAPALDVTETHSHVEVMQEAPEFKELCLTKSNYGGQVSTVFYIPHPTNKGMYIQCNEFGTAYLKTCPIGTIFTPRLTCERVTDVLEEKPVVLRDQPKVTYDSYAAPAVPTVPEPVVLRDTPKVTYDSYAAPAVLTVPEPVVLRDTPKVTYDSYAAPAVPTVPERVILRETPKVVVPTVPQRVILRDQPKAAY